MKLAVLVAALLIFGILVAPSLAGTDGTTNVVKQTNTVNGKVVTGGSSYTIGTGYYNPCDWYNYFPGWWR